MIRKVCLFDGTASKALAGAAISGLSTAVAMATQLNFDTATGNDWFQLVVWSVGSAVAALSGVYVAKNKPIGAADA